MNESLSVQEAADILEVAADADVETIDRAFRTLVKEHHPDVSEDPDATTNFRQVKRAREVLISANKPLMESSSTDADASSTSSSSDNWQQSNRAERESDFDDTEDTQETHEAQGKSPWDGEQWRKERKQNDRTGESRYQQAKKRAEWRRARRSDTRQSDGTVGHGYSRDQAHGSYANQRSRRQEAEQRIGGTIINRVAQLVLMLGVVVTLIPLGLGGELLPVQIDSTAGFALSIGGVTMGVIGRQLILGPSPSATRTQGRTEYDDRISPLPIIAANLIGVGLALLAQYRGFPLSGLQYLFNALSMAFIPGTLGFLLGGYLGTALASEQDLTQQGPLADHRSAIGSMIGLAIGLILSLVQIDGRGMIFYLGLEQASLTGYPWFSQLTIGIFGFAPLLNFLTGSLMFTALFGSAALIVWQFPQFRRVMDYSQTDSRLHGYLSTLSWKLLLIVPVAVFIWMGLAGTQTLSLPVGMVPRQTFGSVILILPTLLLGLAALREHLRSA